MDTQTHIIQNSGWNVYDRLWVAITLHTDARSIFRYPRGGFRGVI